MNVREIDYRAGERVEIDCTHLIGATVGACAACIAKALAAAEERGRRRGVEDLQTMLQNAAPHIIGAGHFRLWNCKCGYCAPLQAALAPRDSGKELDAGGAAVSDPSEAHHNQAWTAYQDCDHATEFMVCDDCVAKAIAAAEERGRRRGVEEAATLCDRRANGHVEGSVAGLEARKCANAVRDIAPRDSEKE